MTSEGDEIIAYVTSVHPMLIDDRLVWDLIYVTPEDTKKRCIRIYNHEVSFMIAALPGMTLTHFHDFISRHTTEKQCRVSYRSDLREATYFQFGNTREYAEIHSRNPTALHSILQDMYVEVRDWYKIILSGHVKLNPADNLFVRNTESPFRFTNCSTNVTRSTYLLATKHKVPLVGGVRINRSALTDRFPLMLHPRIDTLGLNFNNEGLISEIIRPDNTISLFKNITMVAYDIETYNRSGNLSPEPRGNYIFSIGMGIFNLESSTPYKRYCLITKGINGIEGENVTHGLYEDHPTVEVKYEYSEADEKDVTTYIVCKNEYDILLTYIRLLKRIDPHIICGFNSFGFDDNYIYVRADIYGLTSSLLQIYTPYNIDEISEQHRNDLKPKHAEITLKIDGAIQRGQFKTIKSSYTVMVDVRQMLLKEDPKRFTQHGRGRLDDMLLAYRTVNPFTGSQLTKTGLSIAEMYRRWDNDTDIYSIAKYCCQDAWICGTLISNRGKLADSIQMANISCTLFSDSIYRADGFRVAMTLTAYAYMNGYATMDEPAISRSSRTQAEKTGGIVFDKRTVIGGAVENKRPGKHAFVVALDYSGQYPAVKSCSNIDSSSRVDSSVIKDPSTYGLSLVMRREITDMFGPRVIYYLKRV